MKLEIVDYEPRFRDVFRRLNEAWITEYFALEDEDRAILGDPETHILKKGGFIFAALLDGVPVGVVALKKLHDSHYDFEMAKLAVDSTARGNGAGLALGRAALSKVRALGGGSVFIISNSRLVPALNLYKKLGFKLLESPEPVPYVRADIQFVAHVPAAD